MATQTVEFRSPPSQTVTAKLFAIGSDTQVASVTATEATNRKGTYSAAFIDVAAGEYELIALVGAVPVARWFVTLTLTTATFQARDKVGAVELDSAAILAVADQVWDEATSGHTTAGTYGGRIVRATNSNTEVQITGSNHIAADIHNLQSGVITAGDFAANSITASALATDAVTEIQSGLATAAALATESTKITAIETFATRMTTGLVVDGAVYQFTANMLELAPSSGGGDATLAKQNDILAAIQGTEVIQVASPNILGNLVLTQGDDYDGVANPKASWTVTTDYTTGWTVRLTIRDSDDAVVYTNTGSVVSATVIAVTIAAPTGLTMTGCPGQWQGKFDVELTHSSGKKKTIALGVCYINEDQTR